MQLSTLGKHIATSGSLKIVATDSEDVRTAKTEVRSLFGRQGVWNVRVAKNCCLITLGK